LRVAFIVNTVHEGNHGSTTFALANRLSRTGHEVWVAKPGGFALAPDGRIELFARRARESNFRSSRRYVEVLRSDAVHKRWLDVREVDCLFLRVNPYALRDWALAAVLDFARRASEQGVLVLNDAVGLVRATSKMYLEDFPEDVRPRTLVTRSKRRIARFLEEEGRLVLKPLRGYGGRDVFLATSDDGQNLGRIIDAAARDGFVIAQEYLPAAEQGDTRLFLLDGKPIVQQNRHAVVQRTRPADDLRSNVHVGGEPRAAEMTDTLERIAARVRPRLVADGMFLVGLDVAGDRLLEINVFSPGGLQALQELYGVDFTRAVAQALERRVARHASGDPASGDEGA